MIDEFRFGRCNGKLLARLEVVGKSVLSALSYEADSNIILGKQTGDSHEVRGAYYNSGEYDEVLEMNTTSIYTFRKGRLENSIRLVLEGGSFEALNKVGGPEVD